MGRQRALSVAKVRGLGFDPKGRRTQIHYDGGIPGFGVRVFPRDVPASVDLLRK